jgi:hypothetical protein
LKRMVYVNPGPLVDVYAAQDTDGMWVVCKVYIGHTEVSGYCFTIQETAERHALELKREAGL